MLLLHTQSNMLWTASYKDLRAVTEVLKHVLACASVFGPCTDLGRLILYQLVWAVGCESADLLILSATPTHGPVLLSYRTKGHLLLAASAWVGGESDGEMRYLGLQERLSLHQAPGAVVDLRHDFGLGGAPWPCQVLCVGGALSPWARRR